MEPDYIINIADSQGNIIWSVDLGFAEGQWNIWNDDEAQMLIDDMRKMTSDMVEPQGDIVE